MDSQTAEQEVNTLKTNPTEKPNSCQINKTPFSLETKYPVHSAANDLLFTFTLS